MKSFDKFFAKLKINESEGKEKNEKEELVKRLRYLKEKSDFKKSGIKKTRNERQP